MSLASYSCFDLLITVILLLTLHFVYFCTRSMKKTFYNSIYGKKKQHGILHWTARKWHIRHLSDYLRQAVLIMLDTVWWKSPGTAHWVICHWKSSPSPGISIPSTKVKNDHENPPNHSPYMILKWLCWLKIGTCRVPLQRLSHGHCRFYLQQPLKGVVAGHHKWGILWSWILTE